MRLFILFQVIFLCVGCQKEEKAEVAVTWYDSTSIPHRWLDKQNIEIEKGDDFELARGQPVDFKGNNFAVGVRYIWNDQGIFVEGSLKIDEEWKTKRTQLLPKSEGVITFESGIYMTARATK